MLARSAARPYIGRVKRPCLTPRCKALVPQGIDRCPDHIIEHNKLDLAMRGTASARGYDADWDAVQKAYIAANPYCERHLRRGQQRQGHLVDHKRAIRDGGDRLAWDNLETQCRSCHGFKTHAEIKARAPRVSR